MRDFIHKAWGLFRGQVALARIPGARTILVSDGAGWILDRIAQEIVRNLPAEFGGAVTSVVPLSARGRVIHFVNRYAVLEGNSAALLQRRNRVLLSWFHGGRMSNLGREMEEVMERLLKVADHFWAFHVSSSLYVEVLLSLGIEKGRIIYVPIGVDTELFALPRREPAVVRAELGVPPEAIVVGSFQRDGDEGPKRVKGPDILVEALALALKSIPRLHVLLTGPPRGYVTRQLRRRGVPFTYAGLVPRLHELAAYYHACDIYLIPSREEGGPAGLLESMASGVPVVSTRVGMAVDVITPGWNGCLAEVEDVDGLAAGLVRLGVEEELRLEFGRRARETAMRYDWRLVGPEYGRRLYQGVGP